MKKIFERMYITLTIMALVWIGISYFQVIAGNMANWNFFQIVFM